MIADISATNIETWGTLFLVTILVLGHVMRLMASELGWPKWLVEHLLNQRRREIVDVIQGLGIGDTIPDAVEEARLRKNLRNAPAVADPEERARGLVSSALLDRQVVVGQGNPLTYDVFVDVMSCSLRSDYAHRCAGPIVTYLRGALVDPPENVVVGLKHGSPFVAAEVAKAIGLPLALFRGRGAAKYRDVATDQEELFDGDVGPQSRALIIDDSTTSGRGVIECAVELRRRGATVERCVVLFEPEGKNARGELEKNGLRLHAVVRLDPASVAAMRKAGSS